MIDDDRALSAFTDVLAVEDTGTGLFRVVTLSDVYTAVPSEGMHLCPDREYHDVDFCKHVVAVEATRGRLDVPTGWLVVEDLDERTDETFDLDTDGTLFGGRYHLTFDEFEDVADPEDCPDCADDLPCFEHFDADEYNEVKA